MSNELFIYDYIGTDLDGSPAVTAKEFASELKALGPVKEISVRINSGGGDFFEAAAIYNLLKSHPAKVKVHIDGCALSAASFIAMAGDEIEICENGIVMLHAPATELEGQRLTSAELSRGIKVLDASEAALVAGYANRSGIPPAEISRMLAVETWLTASEAVELGFADRIGPELKLAASFNVAAFRNKMPTRIAATLAKVTAGGKWKNEIRKLVDTGLSVAAASSQLNRQNPGLRQRMIEAANPKR